MKAEISADLKSSVLDFAPAAKVGGPTERPPGASRWGDARWPSLRTLVGLVVGWLLVGWLLVGWLVRSFVGCSQNPLTSMNGIAFVGLPQAKEGISHSRLAATSPPVVMFLGSQDPATSISVGLLTRTVTR